MEPATGRRIRWLFVLLLLLYYWAAVWMTFRLPALATPNELLNYEYVAVMRQIRGLPNRGLVDSEIRYTEWHQPPVYFVWAALVGLGVPVERSVVNPPPPIAVDGNPFYTGTHRGNLNPAVHITPQSTPLLYISRLAAVYMGCLALAALYRAAADIHSPATGLLVASLLAFQPNFLHLSGSVNNDMPLAAVTAMVMAYTLLIVAQDRRPRSYLGLGLLLAAAVLTKANGVFVLVFLGGACLLLLLRHHSWSRAIRSGLWGLAGFIPLWVAWLLFNAIRMEDALAVSGSLPVQEVLFQGLSSYLAILPHLAEIWRSFWLDWSTGQIGYGPDWFYLISGLAVLAGLLGWIRRPPRRETARYAFIVVLGVVGISYLYFAVKSKMAYDLGYITPEGRWLLPALPGLAWLSGVGLTRWWPADRRDNVAQLAAAIPPLVAFALLIFLLPSLYPPVVQVSSSFETGERVGFQYDQTLELTAVATPPELTEGEMVEVELTWSALRDIDIDYAYSLQLLTLGDSGWGKLEQQTTYPGYGLNPTRGWRAGERYRDRMVMVPSGQLNGPTRTALAVYAWKGDEAVSALRAGEVLEAPTASTVVVRPVETLLVPEPWNEPVDFGGLLELVAVETVEGEAGIDLTLYWRANTAVAQDYAVFVHLLDADGQLVDQIDGWPNDGLSPTSIWRAGDIIVDERHLAAPLAPDHTILVGIYDTSSGLRLSATQSGASLPADAAPLP